MQKGAKHKSKTEMESARRKVRAQETEAARQHWEASNPEQIIPKPTEIKGKEA